MESLTLRSQCLSPLYLSQTGHQGERRQTLEALMGTKDGVNKVRILVELVIDDRVKGLQPAAQHFPCLLRSSERTSSIPALGDLHPLAGS